MTQHALVKWVEEDKCDVYPIKRITDVSIGIELLQDPTGALQKFAGVLVDVMREVGKPPAPATILAVGNQAYMEKETNILPLEAATTATGAEQTCNHLDEIEALQNTIISLHEELRQTREELGQALHCLDAEKMVKQLKHLLDRASAPAGPVGITPAPKVDIGNGVLVEEGLLKRLHLDAKNSGSRFARSLLKALFTKEELEGKSLFGRLSNAHKGLPQKEPLDSKRVKAILDYTTRNFDVLPVQLKNTLSSLLNRGN